MVLKEYEAARGWRKLRYHLPALYVLVTLGGLLYGINTYRSSFRGMKQPEFVPVYDEKGKLIGMTHPRIVEVVDQRRTQLRKKKKELS